MMRRELSLVLFTLLVAAVRGVLPTLQQKEPNHDVMPRPASGFGREIADCGRFLPYSSDPNHLWNRVHRRLFERRDAHGVAWGCDEVDPLLWGESHHILANPAYAETIRLLDEFTTTHAEQLIRDPLARGVFQSDLWAVFEWLARSADDHQGERAELERRLAAIMKAVALTPLEIQRLPDNYSQLRGKTTDDGLVLPDPAGGWLLVGRDDATPVAPFHSSFFTRSLFLVFLKLPTGGPEPSKYLESMRIFSRQRPHDNPCQFHACGEPQFPVGTELALVRRALLIDAAGQLVASPITESVQLRRYSRIPPGANFDFDNSTQQVAEFQITRRPLAQGVLGLRRVGEDETHFSVFMMAYQADRFENSFGNSTGAKILPGCHDCHQGIGVRSFTSYSRMQMQPDHFFVLLRSSTEAQEAAVAIAYLQTSNEWMLWKRMRGGSSPGSLPHYHR